MGTSGYDPHSIDPSLQGQGQGQLQGELQGQGQLQGQGELQGQGQAQTESTTSLNGNGNGNLNLDGNANGNLNGNENSNCDNAASSATSAADNCSTTCDNVDVKVDVAVCDTVGPPSETGVLNMDGLSLCNSDGSFVVMPDLGSQTLTGNGNIFHLDQVNDLVNNGTVSDLSDGLSVGSIGGSSDGGYPLVSDFSHLPSEGGSASGSSFSFSQTGSATGGTSTLGDGGTAGTIGGAVTQEAFTQHVILGSNIQYNSLPITIVGHDSITAGHDASHA